MTDEEVDLAIKQAIKAERSRIALMIQDRFPHNKEPFCRKCDLLHDLMDQGNE